MFGNIVVFQCTGKLNILFGENKADVMVLWMLIIISEWYYLLFNSVHISCLYFYPYTVSAVWR